MNKLSALAIIAAFALTPALAQAQTATPVPAKPAAQAITPAVPAPTATVKLDCTKVENKAKTECLAAGVKK